MRVDVGAAAYIAPPILALDLSGNRSAGRFMGSAAAVRPAGPAPPALRSGIEPPATRGFPAVVLPMDPAPSALRYEVELPAGTRDFAAEVGSVTTAQPPLLARWARGATHFCAEVRLPGGGPRSLLGAASPEQPLAGKTAGEVPTAVGFAVWERAFFFSPP